jgi:hypothetical protein
MKGRAELKGFALLFCAASGAADWWLTIVGPAGIKKGL